MDTILLYIWESDIRLLVIFINVVLFIIGSFNLSARNYIYQKLLLFVYFLQDLATIFTVALAVIIMGWVIHPNVLIADWEQLIGEGLVVAGMAHIAINFQSLGFKLSRQRKQDEQQDDIVKQLTEIQKQVAIISHRTNHIAKR